MAAKDYVKQVQTKANREIRKIDKEWGVSKSQIREVFEQLGINPDSPSEEELQKVVTEIVGQFSQKEEVKSSADSAELVAFDQAAIGITPEENPDLWEALQPPAEEASAQSNEEAIASEQEQKENSIIPAAANNLPNQQSESGLVPQSEVANLVNQAFASQPPQLQQQITEYAMARTFSNVREVQEFLEQLRSMEFRLLVETLNDHVSRRGSMLTLLNQLLENQQSKDKETTASFFGSAYNQVNQFQKEMKTKLSKQGL